MKNKGISLIVLIITIVVIIILATAIIVNLAQTNIIENANEAVVKQDIKTFQDELDLYKADKYVDALGEFDITTINADTEEGVIAIIPSVKNSKYKEYISIANGKIIIKSTMPEPEKTWAMEALNQEKYQSIAVNTKVEGKNATINGENPTYNNPVIPVGFKAVETTKASWESKDGVVEGWNDGLVIIDEVGNEYVWIPVDGKNVTYSKWNSSINTQYTVKKDQVKDDTLPKGVSSEIYQISKYGGFYVARYEAGLPDEQTTEELMATKTFSATDNNRSDIGKAQSKPDKIVWNRIDYTNAKILSENVISTNYVQSGLVTGTQWDTMLTFLSQEVDVDVNCVDWGNYKDKYGYTINGYYRPQHADGIYTKGEYTKSELGYVLLPTGKFGSAVEAGSSKNLFDVGGNVWEWCNEIVTTTEQAGTPAVNSVCRGGSYDADGNYGVASCRVGMHKSTNGGGANVGFRFVLYIK